MLIMNMFTQAGYGREMNTTLAPMDERSSEREQSPSAYPQDCVEISGDSLPEQGRAAAYADSTKALRNFMRHAFRKPVSPNAAPETEAQKTGARKSLDLSLNPEVRRSFDEYLRKRPTEVPRLKQYEAVSEATKKYNCIANSVRDENQIIPPEITVDRYDKFYEKYGFKPLDNLDYSLQDGYEKVVLYGFKPSDGEAYTMRKNANDELPPGYKDPLCYHAIVQEKDGTWSSKMGKDERIRVLDPDELGGGLYGNPVRVYVRKRP